MTIDEQVKLIFKSLSSSTNNLSSQNVTQLLEFCLQYSRFDKFYKLLGSSLGKVFVMDPQTKLQDRWIYSISDSEDEDLIAVIKQLLINQIKDPSLFLRLMSYGKKHYYREL